MGVVLVGIDGSEDSRMALRWAAAYADAVGAPLRALWAWQHQGDSAAAIGLADAEEVAAAHARVEAQLGELLVDVMGDAARGVTATAARGPAAAALLDAVADDDASMLVVGSRGRGGFKSLLLGSVGRQLCEHAPCPVTVVRGSLPAETVRLGTIVVGVDGSPDAQRALSFAAELSADVGAELVVVHAVFVGEPVHPPFVDPSVDLESQRELAEGWCAPLHEGGVAHELVVVEGDARRVLLDVARDRAADLLVLGSRGRGAIASLVLGSVTASVVHDAEVPVTVVPHAG